MAIATAAGGIEDCFFVMAFASRQALILCSSFHHTKSGDFPPRHETFADLRFAALLKAATLG
jgi:hypothetical protein